MSHARRLIVTADDFGLSAGVNQAVVQAHREGILTCASLMVNETGFEEAVSLARENPRLGVGLHLTLLDGHSTLARPDIPGLVNDDREFTRDPGAAGLRYFVRQRRLRPQLRAEIRAQFQKFRSTGLALDHVNSHHHLHAHPVVFDVLMEVASEVGMTHLRLPLEPSEARDGIPGALSWRDRVHIAFHSIMASRCKPMLRRAGIRHNDWMMGLSRTGRLDEQYLTSIIRRLRPGMSEIYAHPSSGALQHELDALTSRSVRQVIKASNVQLMRFGEM